MQDKLQIVFKGIDAVKKNNKIEQIIKKIEKIRKLSIDKYKLIDKIKLIQEIYEANFKLMKPQINETYIDYLNVLIEKYNLKRFAKWEKEIIENIINDTFEYLNEINYMSDEISKICEEFNKQIINNMSKSEKIIRNVMAKDIFQNLGMEFEEDYDFDLFFNENNQENLKEKFFENFQKQKIEDQVQEKKQLIKNTDIDFKDLYKKLAKLLHPDLAKTEFDRVEKEKIMQSLTSCWNERNYYELLMIWMEHDVKNTCNLEINEINHKNILNQLNDKMNLINKEILDIKKTFGDTAFYFQFNAANELSINKNIKSFLHNIKIELNDTVENTKTFKTTKELKTYLHSIRAENENNFDFFEVLNIFKV
jgi:hypothetical protein